MYPYVVDFTLYTTGKQLSMCPHVSMRTYIRKQVYAWGGSVLTLHSVLLNALEIAPRLRVHITLLQYTTSYSSVDGELDRLRSGRLALLFVSRGYALK